MSPESSVLDCNTLLFLLPTTMLEVEMIPFEYRIHWSLFDYHFHHCEKGPHTSDPTGFSIPTLVEKYV